MTVAIFRFSPILWLHVIQYGGVEARKYIAFIVVSFAFFDFFFCFLRSFFFWVSLPSLELFVVFAIVWIDHSFSSAPVESCRFVYELSPLTDVYACHWVSSIFVVLYQISSSVFGYFSWRVSSVYSSAENYAYTVKKIINEFFVVILNINLFSDKCWIYFKKILFKQ